MKTSWRHKPNHFTNTKVVELLHCLYYARKLVLESIGENDVEWPGKAQSTTVGEACKATA